VQQLFLTHMLQVYQPSDFFFPLFTVVFVAVLIIIFLSVIANLIRVFRKPSEMTLVEKETPLVREREIIREIVKIRCPYCNNLYDEKYDKCPHCGGKRKP